MVGEGDQTIASTMSSMAEAGESPTLEEAMFMISLIKISVELIMVVRSHSILSEKVFISEEREVIDLSKASIEALEEFK